LADGIRDLFPALVMMEDARPAGGQESGGLSGVTGAASGKKLDRLGDYRILREVGRGGMGIVYEAEQESLGRHIALKVLPGAATLDPRSLQRFQREARAAARLHHTNIVPVFGVGEHDGLHYYVMQFIHGLGLDEVLVELRRLRRAKRNGSGDPNDPQHSSPKSERGDSGSSPAVAAPPLARWAGMPAAEAAGQAEQVAEALISGQFRAAPGGPIEAAKPPDTGSSSLRVQLSPSDSCAGTRAMAWSPDGQLLASGNWDGRIFVRHLPNGELISVLEGEVYSSIVRASRSLARNVRLGWYDATVGCRDRHKTGAGCRTNGSFLRG
jgi:hypothetical protein